MFTRGYPHETATFWPHKIGELVVVVVSSRRPGLGVQDPAEREVRSLERQQPRFDASGCWVSGGV